jgi:GNAT superfamily N-acetyltransferase
MLKIELKKGSESDYLSLSELHYASKYTFEADEFYIAECYGQVIGVAAMQTIIGDLPEDLIDSDKILSYISSSIQTCKRLIVHPDWRNLGVGKRLLSYICENHPHLIIELRSSFFRNTGIIERWGGELVDRPYRNSVPAYDTLVTMLKKQDINFENMIKDNHEYSDKIKKIDLSTMHKLISERLKEIDNHQWLYIKDLTDRIEKFSLNEYIHAKEKFLEYYENTYKNKDMAELLLLCARWDSAAYILSIKYSNQKIV